MSGNLSFAAGETTKTVTVAVNGDLLDEVNETYSLGLSNPTNVTIGGSGLGTITDNDPLPALAIGDVSVTEGDSGTANATFTVTLSTVSGRTVTVDYATANGTAIAPADYTALPLTALSFSPGQTTPRSPSSSTPTSWTRATRPSTSTSRVRPERRSATGSAWAPSPMTTRCLR